MALSFRLIIISSKMNFTIQHESKEKPWNFSQQKVPQKLPLLFSLKRKVIELPEKLVERKSESRFRWFQWLFTSSCMCSSLKSEKRNFSNIKWVRGWERERRYIYFYEFKLVNCHFLLCIRKLWNLICLLRTVPKIKIVLMAFDLSAFVTWKHFTNHMDVSYRFPFAVVVQTTIYVNSLFSLLKPQSPSNYFFQQWSLIFSCDCTYSNSRLNHFSLKTSEINKSFHVSCRKIMFLIFLRYFTFNQQNW